MQSGLDFLLLPARIEEEMETILGILFHLSDESFHSLYLEDMTGHLSRHYYIIQAPLHSSNQGVNLVIVFNPKWGSGPRIYIGSSWGESGLQNRIFKNHAKQSYRKRDNGKYLYALMDEAGTTWKFVALAVFRDTAPKQLVLIAEAIMCSLFSSYTLKAYRDFRPPETFDENGPEIHALSRPALGGPSTPHM